MIFKVPARREEMGDPLDMYSVNHDNSPTQPLFRIVERRQDSCYGVWGGKDCELDLESCELLGGQIMR